MPGLQLFNAFQPEIKLLNSMPEFNYSMKGLVKTKV